MLCTPEAKLERSAAGSITAQHGGTGLELTETRTEQAAVKGSMNSVSVWTKSKLTESREE